jgi:hypothetical protein
MIASTLRASNARSSTFPLAHRALDDRDLIAHVGDREALREAELRRVLAHHLGAERVKRAERDGLRLRAGELHRALPHLGGRLVRERHRENAVGRHLLLLHQPREPVDDDARLAGARAGQHEQWTFRGRHCFTLGSVQPRKIHAAS